MMKKVLLVLSIFFTVSAHAQLVVITNKKMPVTSMTQDEIYRIYLGKTKFLSNGEKIIPVDQKVGSPSRNKFYGDLIRKSDTELKSYWARIMFTGQGNPPIQEADDQSVKTLVSNNPNFMGYIDKANLDDSVNVVFTVP